jgi:hypothetical protein
VQNAAWVAAWVAARDAAWDVVYALIVWDDVAYILDMSPDACRMLIHTAEGHHEYAALLLLPAVTALDT